MAPILALPPDRRIGSLAVDPQHGPRPALRPAGRGAAWPGRSRVSAPWACPSMPGALIRQERTMTIAAEDVAPHPAGRRARPGLQDAGGLDTPASRCCATSPTPFTTCRAEAVVVRLAAGDHAGQARRLVDLASGSRAGSPSRGFPPSGRWTSSSPSSPEGFLATFWHHEEHHRAAAPDPAQLGPLLRRLHDLPPVPFELPTHDPFGAVRRADSGQPGARRRRTAAGCSNAATSSPRPTTNGCEFVLPYGLMHGDAHRGNMIRTGDGFLLCDWDGVCAGPREIDLIPTLQGARFGLTRAAAVQLQRDLRLRRDETGRAIRCCATCVSCRPSPPCCATPTATRGPATSWGTGSPRCGRGTTACGTRSSRIGLTACLSSRLFPRLEALLPEGAEADPVCRR